MNVFLNDDNELPLLCNDNRAIAFEELEQWQVDQLTRSIDSDSLSLANKSLQEVDNIVQDWVQELTKDEWSKIKRQQSLYGIKIPEKWIKVWRVILKDFRLRDPERATRGGQAIGSYSHIWNLWSKQCIEKYLSSMEKDLLQMVDSGLLYSEIGEIMLSRYGDAFWKPRKTDTKTTPSQVVNNYLYLKMPKEIARSELTDLVLQILRNN